MVGIVVDQLRTDYVEYLKELFGEKGFRQLMQKGVFIRDLDFRRSADDAAAATAVLYTGNWPSANGVPSAGIYDPTTKRSLPAMLPADAGASSGKYSPEALRLSTIADEIAIDGAGLAAVYSVAADPQQAVIMTGHAGTSAAWIDDNNARWAGSSYYTDFPQALQRINQFNPLSRRLDTLQWKPSRPLSEYPGLPGQKKYYPFRHSFYTNDRNAVRRFKTAAPVNDVVTDAAIEIIKSRNLGKRGDAIDMINLAYTAAPYKESADGDFRVELEDTYLRLDAQLGRLLDEIDRNVGLDNTLVYLASTGYYDDATVDDPKYRIPGGEFSLKRAESLLNAYLSAKYGNADFIDAIHDGQVYIDRRAVEQRGQRIDAVRADAREFMSKMSGVAGAYTLSEVLAGDNPDISYLALSVDPKTCGDVFLTFFPGWTVKDDISYPPTDYPVRYGQVLTPGFILWPALEATTIDTPVEAVTLAPTITSNLHIRSPNGALRRPLPLK